MFSLFFFFFFSDQWRIRKKWQRPFPCGFACCLSAHQLLISVQEERDRGEEHVIVTDNFSLLREIDSFLLLLLRLIPLPLPNRTEIIVLLIVFDPSTAEVLADRSIVSVNKSTPSAPVRSPQCSSSCRRKRRRARETIGWFSISFPSDTLTRHSGGERGRKSISLLLPERRINESTKKSETVLLFTSKHLASMSFCFDD